MIEESAKNIHKRTNSIQLNSNYLIMNYCYDKHPTNLIKNIKNKFIIKFSNFFQLISAQQI